MADTIYLNEESLSYLAENQINGVNTRQEAIQGKNRKIEQKSISQGSLQILA